MIKKNNQTIGTIYKGSTPIEKIYKGSVLVWEGWKKLIKQGIPPLTLSKCKDDKIINYKIYGNSVDRILPTGYIQLDYIESTGTQYIDTGLVLNQNSKIEMELSNAYGTKVLGARSSATSRNFSVFKPTQSQLAFDFLSYSQSRITHTLSENNERFTMTVSKSEFTVNGKKLKVSVSGSFTTATNCYLLNANGSFPSGWSMLSAKFYGCKMYNSSTLVRNFVPCISPSNEVGAYDTVNNVFYKSAGTEEFVAGNIVNIKSLGNLIYNLFNKNSFEYLDGYLTYVISNPEIKYVRSSTASTTFYIPCLPNTTYTVYKGNYIPSGTATTSMFRVAGATRVPTPRSSTSEAVEGDITDYTAGTVSDELIVHTTGDKDNYLLFTIGGLLKTVTDGIARIKIFEGEYTSQTIPTTEPYGYKIPVKVYPNLYKNLEIVDYFINNSGQQATSDTHTKFETCTVEIDNTKEYICKWSDYVLPSEDSESVLIQPVYYDSSDNFLLKQTLDVRTFNTDYVRLDIPDNTAYITFYNDTESTRYGQHFINFSFIEKGSESTEVITLDEPLRKIGTSDLVELPNGYTQLDYIESTRTQYIDTGVKNVDSTKFTYEYKMRQTVEGAKLPTGARSSANTRLMWGIIGTTVGGNYQVGYGSTFKNVQINEELLNKWNIIKSEIIDNKYRISLIGNSTYYTDFDLESFDTSQQIYLFGCNNQGSLFTTYAYTGDIQYVKMYDDGMLIRHFIPCINDQNEIGMYDLVEGVFYSNQGTGTFTAGPQIYADYIDFENQKVYRNVEVIDDTGTLPMDEAFRGLDTTIEENIQLQDILLNKGENVVDTDTELAPSNLLVKYKGKEV